MPEHNNIRYRYKYVCTNTEIWFQIVYNLILWAQQCLKNTLKTFKKILLNIFFFLQILCMLSINIYT